MKHIFFDMDGTLTESRQPMGSNWYDSMKELARKFDVIIVSGASADQMATQIPRGIFDAMRMSQNGNVLISENRKCPVWKRELDWMQKRTVFNEVHKMIMRENLVRPDMRDLVEDRGCQISFSAIGHNAPIAEKRAWDPQGHKRSEFLSRMHRTVLNHYGVQWAIGGTTCIDFYLHTKGENVKRLIEVLAWSVEDCIYVGDALFEGGNDATVIGVVPTYQVRDLNDTIQFIHRALA